MTWTNAARDDVIKSFRAGHSQAEIVRAITRAHRCHGSTVRRCIAGVDVLQKRDDKNWDRFQRMGGTDTYLRDLKRAVDALPQKEKWSSNVAAEDASVSIDTFDEWRRKNLTSMAQAIDGYLYQLQRRLQVARSNTFIFRNTPFDAAERAVLANIRRRERHLSKLERDFEDAARDRDARAGETALREIEQVLARWTDL